MTASLVEQGGCLALSGRVTADNAVALREQGKRWLAAQAGNQPLTVGLGGAETASSVLLSLLLCWQREASRQQRELLFSDASAGLTELAKLNGVSRWLTSPA